jgi:hypothetical protein
MLVQLERNLMHCKNVHLLFIRGTEMRLQIYIIFKMILNNSVVHSASFEMGNGGSFPEGKAAGA